MTTTDGMHGDRSTRLLVVEDDETLRVALEEFFSASGYAVTVAADGDAARRALSLGSFDVVLLDLMLPGPGGLEVLRELRITDAGTPVIIMTARADESDKVLGLELGADDYVTKPFGLRELHARVKAQLRRATLARDALVGEAATTLRLGAVEVDLGRYRVVREGAADEVGLSPKEAAILRLLVAADGRAVERAVFLDEVWGSDRFVTNRTIDTHVLNLRAKLEADPKAPRHLLTVHGVGYRLVVEP